jgi:hypothetical protein
MWATAAAATSPAHATLDHMALTLKLLSFISS